MQGTEPFSRNAEGVRGPLGPGRGVLCRDTPAHAFGVAAKQEVET